MLPFLACGTSSYVLVRAMGYHRMVRQQVSPRGGNLLSFHLMRRFFGGVFGLLGPIRVKGAGNVPPQGGCIIAPTHTSDCDVVALYVGLPRWAWFVAKEELFTIPFVGWLIRQYHAFPIRPAGPADRAAMKQILDLLAIGEAVIIFPEGKLTEDGFLQEFQPGTAMLALRAGVPVIPAALNGTRRVLPYGWLVPRPSFRKVRISLGKPVDFTNLPEDRHLRLEEATRRIRRGVVDLLRDINPNALHREPDIAAQEPYMVGHTSTVES